MLWQVEDLSTNQVSTNLDNQRIDILGDEIEKKIITQPLHHGVVRMSQCESDQILVHSPVRSEVDVADSEIKGEDGEESVEETHSGDSS